VLEGNALLFKKVYSAPYSIDIKPTLELVTSEELTDYLSQEPSNIFLYYQGGISEDFQFVPGEELKEFFNSDNNFYPVRPCISKSSKLST